MDNSDIPGAQVQDTSACTNIASFSTPSDGASLDICSYHDKQHSVFATPLHHVPFHSTYGLDRTNAPKYSFQYAKFSRMSRWPAKAATALVELKQLQYDAGGASRDI